MKSLFLVGALALSLAANVWLISTRQPSSSSSVPPPEKTAAAKSNRLASTAAVAATAVTWDSLHQGDDLPALVAGLRAAGFPNDTIRAIAVARLNDRFLARRKAIFNPTAFPFWKPVAPMPAEQMALRSLNAEIQQELRSLGLEPLTREEHEIQTRRYGNLSPEKAAALEKISLDYLDLFSQLARNDGQTPRPPSEAQRLLLEKEKRDDLAGLLTPAELVEYELRNSTTSNLLRISIRDLDVSEDEYRTLFKILRTKELEHPSPIGPLTNEIFAEQVSAQSRTHEQIRATLGDERYQKYLLADPSNRDLARFTGENPGMTLDQLVALVDFPNLLNSALLRATNTPGQTPDQRRAAAYYVQAEHRALMASKLSAGHLAALVNGNYGQLSRLLKQEAPPPKN